MNPLAILLPAWRRPRSFVSSRSHAPYKYPNLVLARPLGRAVSAPAPGMQTGNGAASLFAGMPPDWQPEDPHERAARHFAEAGNAAVITLAIAFTILALVVLVGAALAGALL
jgi:hypothetical protein